jgi:hypothetical protein
MTITNTRKASRLAPTAMNGAAINSTQCDAEARRTSRWFIG